MAGDILEAVGQGDLSSVRAFPGEDPQSVRTRGLMGMTPLHMAAMSCDQALARLLIDTGADVHARKDDGWTPLHQASQNGDEAMVCLLLDHGADPHVSSNIGLTALHVAANGASETTIGMLQAVPGRADPLILDHEAVVRLLISRGADTNATENVHGATALHLAVYQGHQGVMHVLLDCDADLNVRSKGWTPLHLAAGRCDEEMVRALLEKGADIDAPGNEGKTPRDTIGMACETCDPAVRTRIEDMLISR